MTIGARLRWVGVATALGLLGVPAAPRSQTARPVADTAARSDTSVAAADTAAADSVAVDTTAVAPVRMTFPRGPFASLGKADYLRQHSYSFDHFLQFQPGVVLARRGPIGGDVLFSRFGIGRGRGRLVYNGIAMNDPQNGVAPVTHFPVSTLGVVSVLSGGDAAAIEGVVRVDDLSAPPARPRTFLELSKGTNNLRQRRVYFSSAEAPVGIDFSYDELLNDGYKFDATEAVGLFRENYGSSTSRQYGLRVRGRFADGGRYSAGIREFNSTFQGDLVSSSRELRRDGHLATATARFQAVGLTLYERGFSSTYPDSLTENTTTAARVNVRAGDEDRSLVVSGGVEDIASRQRVGGSESNSSLIHTTAGLDAVSRLGRGGALRLWLRGEEYRRAVSQWGGGVSLRVARESYYGGVQARRNFRMPTLGELFLPAHTIAARTVSGNQYLDAEYTWEAAGHVGATLGPVTAETRITGIRVKDPVSARAQEVGGELWVVPQNTGGALLYVFEERVRVGGDYRGVDLRGEGAATFTSGDRTGFFASSPQVMLHGSFRVGGSMFEKTSALYAGVEYMHCGERVGFDGTMLGAYDVFNFTLDGRLLDANMYLALFNAFDEVYRTEGNFLMTPRTFVYGISWTLWE